MQDDFTEREIDNLTDIRSQLFDLKKTLDRFTSEVESLSTELDDETTVKLPSLNIPTFDGEPTKWKTYWQKFEATIHNSNKLDNQLRTQYLLKSLTTQKAKDAIAALKARFDRPQVIHRAHVRALLTVSPVQNGTSTELRQLHDTLQHHLRSLKAMDKLDIEHFMTALGESKLDPLQQQQQQQQQDLFAIRQ